MLLSMRAYGMTLHLLPFLLETFGEKGPAAFGLFMVFATYFGKSSFSGVFSLYAMQQFQYSTTEVGSLLMIMGLVAAITVLTVSNAALKPASLSMITRHSKENYGAALGVADVYMGLGRVLGPLWAGFAYDLHMRLPFMTGAAFFIITLLTTLRKRDLTSQAESPSLKAGGPS